MMWRTLSNGINDLLEFPSSVDIRAHVSKIFSVEDVWIEGDLFLKYSNVYDLSLATHSFERSFERSLDACALENGVYAAAFRELLALGCHVVLDRIQQMSCSGIFGLCRARLRWFRDYD